MSYNNYEIILKVQVHVLNAVHAEKMRIMDETLIFKEGFMDSMGFIVLISLLEKEFGIKTVDEDLIEENFESINAIAAFVFRKLQSSLCAE